MLKCRLISILFFGFFSLLNGQILYLGISSNGKNYLQFQAESDSFVKYTRSLGLGIYSPAVSTEKFIKKTRMDNPRFSGLYIQQEIDETDFGYSFSTSIYLENLLINRKVTSNIRPRNWWVKRATLSEVISAHSSFACSSILLNRKYPGVGYSSKSKISIFRGKINSIALCDSTDSDSIWRKHGCDTVLFNAIRIYAASTNRVPGDLSVFTTSCTWGSNELVNIRIYDQSQNVSILEKYITYNEDTVSNVIEVDLSLKFSNAISERIRVLNNSLWSRTGDYGALGTLQFTETKDIVLNGIYAPVNDFYSGLWFVGNIYAFKFATNSLRPSIVGSNFYVTMNGDLKSMVCVSNSEVIFWDQRQRAYGAVDLNGTAPVVKISNTIIPLTRLDSLPIHVDYVTNVDVRPSGGLGGVSVFGNYIERFRYISNTITQDDLIDNSYPNLIHLDELWDTVIFSRFTSPSISSSVISSLSGCSQIISFSYNSESNRNRSGTSVNTFERGKGTINN